MDFQVFYMNHISQKYILNTDSANTDTIHSSMLRNQDLKLSSLRTSSPNVLQNPTCACVSVEVTSFDCFCDTTRDTITSSRSILRYILLLQDDTCRLQYLSILILLQFSTGYIYLLNTRKVVLYLQLPVSLPKVRVGHLMTF